MIKTPFRFVFWMGCLGVTLGVLLYLFPYVTYQHEFYFSKPQYAACDNIKLYPRIIPIGGVNFPHSMLSPWRIDIAILEKSTRWKRARVENCIISPQGKQGEISLGSTEYMPFETDISEDPFVWHGTKSGMQYEHIRPVGARGVIVSLPILLTSEMTHNETFQLKIICELNVGSETGYVSYVFYCEPHHHTWKGIVFRPNLLQSDARAIQVYGKKVHEGGNERRGKLASGLHLTH